MVNFACRIKDATALSCNHEIDQANWFFPTQAKEVIYPNSLAQEFLNAWLDKQGLITNVEDQGKVQGWERAYKLQSSLFLLLWYNVKEKKEELNL